MTISLISKSELRLEVLVNDNKANGLDMTNLPYVTMQDGVVACTQKPIAYRGQHRDLTRYRYFTPENIMSVWTYVCHS